MAQLQLHYADGRRATQELSRTNPVSIGRHSSNDISVDEPGVPTLHCRISWTRAGYEVAAAGKDGVDINGTLVRQRVLAPGDTLRVGSLDLTFFDENATGRQAAVDLPPEVSRSGSQRRAAVERPVSRPVPESEELVASEIVASNTLDEMLAAGEFALPPRKDQAPASPPPVVRRALRPGEQDPLRSPLVLGLGGGAVALVLCALTLWFIIGRQSSAQMYQAALTAYESRNYAQAIEGFETFLAQHPRHESAPVARVNLGMAKVEQALGGASPQWAQGLADLESTVRDNQQFTDFATLQPQIVKLAQRIALGAAGSAGKLHQPDLLKTVATSHLLLQRHSEEGEAREKLEQQIQAALTKAEAEILKHGTLTSTQSAIDQALKKRDVLAALTARSQLLDRYPDLESDKGLRERLVSILKLEQGRTQRLESAAPVATDAEIVPPSDIYLARHTRTRTDETQGDMPVFAVASGMLLAVDPLNGHLLWRRWLGEPAAFPPVPVSGEVLGLLAYDAFRQELVLLKRQTGELLWQVPFPHRPRGTPLLHDGQAFVSTADGCLAQLDLQGGKLHALLKFEQPLAGAPVLLGSQGDLLLVPGEQRLLYTVTHRPLACVGITLSNHAAGTLQAPLLQMANLVLVSENDQQASALLTVWDATGKDHSLKRRGSLRVKGHVTDTPVLRGKQLFVPSNPERITAITVSDRPRQTPLVLLDDFPLEKPQAGPMYVTADANDELWMSSSRLRKFKITRDRLAPLTGAELALGICRQPPQMLEQNLFLAYSPPFTQAITFLSADRERMVGQWQLIAGAQILASATADPTSANFITDTGDVFPLSETQLASSSILERPTLTLKIPEGYAGGVRAVAQSDGSCAVWIGGAQPRLWIVGPNGTLTQDVPLKLPLEAAPVSNGTGWWLPVQGRLRLQRRSADQAAVQDFRLPVRGQDAVHWQNVVSLDDQQALAVTQAGRVSRIQLRQEPTPHLFEVAHLDLGKPVDQPVILHEQRLVVATGPVLQQMEGATLEPRGTYTASGPITAGPWGVGAQILAVVGGDKLQCLDASDLRPLWDRPLENNALVGTPLAWKEGLLIAREHGQVELLNAASGEVMQTAQLGQDLANGPWLVGETVVVATRAGGIQPVKLAEAQR